MDKKLEWTAWLIDKETSLVSVLIFEFRNWEKEAEQLKESLINSSSTQRESMNLCAINLMHGLEVLALQRPAARGAEIWPSAGCQQPAKTSTGFWIRELGEDSAPPRGLCGCSLLFLVYWVLYFLQAVVALLIFPRHSNSCVSGTVRNHLGWRYQSPQNRTWPNLREKSSKHQGGGLLRHISGKGL